VHCNSAEQKLDQQSHTWRGVNALEVWTKAKLLGIEYTFDKLMRCGSRHPKVRIQTAVRHLSSPDLGVQYSISFAGIPAY